jgi:hypothetical protein
VRYDTGTRRRVDFGLTACFRDRGEMISLAMEFETLANGLYIGHVESQC